MGGRSQVWFRLCTLGHEQWSRVSVIWVSTESLAAVAFVGSSRAGHQCNEECVAECNSCTDIIYWNRSAAGAILERAETPHAYGDSTMLARSLLNGVPEMKPIATAIATIVALLVTLSPALAAESKVTITEQCTDLISRAKEATSESQQQTLLLDAERKALRVVENEDPRYVPAWACLAKVAWFFGETEKLASRVFTMSELDATHTYPQLMSDCRWLLQNPKIPSLPRPKHQGPTPGDDDAYESTYAAALAAEERGEHDRARGLYYACHQIEPDGELEQDIAGALYRLCIERAHQLATAGRWPEVWSLAQDYLNAYSAEAGDTRTEEAVYLSAVSSQHLDKPQMMHHWAQVYLDLYPGGQYAQQLKQQVTGDVSTDYFETLVNEVRTALRAGTEEGARNARTLIEEAAGVAGPGHGEADIDYLWGFYYANVPEQQYGKARDCFLRYVAKAPNGAYLQDAYAQLRWLDQPLILFTAAERGCPSDERLLWYMRADGSAPRAITDDQVGYIIASDDGSPLVAISPDRTLLAFATMAADGLRVYISRFDGAERHAIWTSQSKTGSVDVLEWAPSRSEMRIKFHAWEQGSDAYIWTSAWPQASRPANATKLEDTRTSVSNARRLLSRWSPDGEYLGWLNPEGQLFLARPPFGKQNVTRLDLAKLEKEIRHFEPTVIDFVWTLPTITDSRPVVIGCTPTSVFRFDLQPSAVGSPVPTAEAIGFVPESRKGTWEVIPEGRIARIGCSSDGDSVALLRIPRTTGDSPAGVDTGELIIYRLGQWENDGKVEYSMKRMEFVRCIPGVDAFAFSPTGARLAYRTHDGVHISRFDAIPANDKRAEGTLGTTPFFWSQRDGQLLTTLPEYIALTYDRVPLAQWSKPASDAAAERWLHPQWSPDSRIVAIQKSSQQGEGIIICERETTASRGEWQVLDVPSAQAGTMQLVGWLSSLQ